MDTSAKVQGFSGSLLILEVSSQAKAEIVEHQAKNVRLIISDERVISPLQRNKIFALVKDIAEWAYGIRRGDRRGQHDMLCTLQLLYVIDLADTEAVRDQLTYRYCELQGIDLFSLSEQSPDAVDMSTASDFIDWMIELCVACGIPCIDTLLNRCEDTGRYLYACVANRSCALCGKHADIHEWDRVGSGRNREKIHHIGQRVQPLCREHHQEVHSKGQQSFDDLYHIGWIRLDEKLCQSLNWRA